MGFSKCNKRIFILVCLIWILYHRRIVVMGHCECAHCGPPMCNSACMFDCTECCKCCVYFEARVGLLVFGLIWLVLSPEVDGACGNCGACTRRYGCMTPAWGKCCTQFFMHNGKRSEEPAGQEPLPNLTDYLKHMGHEHVHPSSKKRTPDDHAKKMLENSHREREPVWDSSENSIKETVNDPAPFLNKALNNVRYNRR